jgi:hypothetical protein
VCPTVIYWKEVITTALPAFMFCLFSFMGFCICYALAIYACVESDFMFLVLLFYAWI